MASCDIFACVAHIFSPERRSAAAEQSAKRLGALYGSYVVDATHRLEAEMRKGRAQLLAIQHARAQKNDALVQRLLSESRDTTKRIRELNESKKNHDRLAAQCERAAEQLRDARQYRQTVSALGDVQNRFKSMRLDKLVRGAEDAKEAVGEAQFNLAEIGNILGAPFTPEDAAPVGDVEAELEALLGGVVADTMVPPAPPADEPTRKLPTVAAYASALGAA